MIESIAAETAMNDVVKALLLCRTPLQAYLCEHLVRTGIVEKYDLCYVSQLNHEADRFYFSRLARHAQNAACVFERPSRLSILNNLCLSQKIGQFVDTTKYSCVYLASIDSFPFGRVLKAHDGLIFTFDDGAGNIITPGTYNPPLLPRDRFYRRLFGLPSPESIAKVSSGHFTIYNDLPNIVEKSRCCFINIFSSIEIGAEPKGSVRFFVGQPFSEYLSKDQIRRLIRYLERLKIDYYVRHPRERILLTNRFPVLETEGRLGEIAILKAARQSKPVIYGCFSSILLNVNATLADKYYLSLSDSLLESRQCALARATGCYVIEIK